MSTVTLGGNPVKVTGNFPRNEPGYDAALAALK
jgi:hypothetical protein